MKRIIRFWPLVLVLAAIAGGYWFYQTRLAPGSASAATGGTYTQIVQVKQGSLSSTLSVVGELDAEQTETFTFSHAGGTTTLAKLNVAAGNSVAKGQVLASIDAASYQQALDQAKSDLQAAQKTLDYLKAPPTELEIAQANLAIAQAQYDEENAKQGLADLQSPDQTTLQNAVLDAQDAITQAEYSQILAEHDSLAKSERDLSYSADWYSRRIRDLEALKNPNLEKQQMVITRTNQLAESQADLARVQSEQQLGLQAAAAAKAKAQVALATAQKSLATAQAGGDSLALAKAQLDLQTAQVALAKANSDRTTLDQGADAATLASAQAALDQKQLALADAQAALDGTQLVASFDGTVLQTNLQPGDQLSATTTVLTVANLKALQVVAAVDETTIKRIVAGQSATISFDAFPGQSFKGTVLSVPLQGSLQNDVMVYQVPLSLQGADKVSLLVGMTANVKIAVAQVSDALLVPTMALQKVNGLYQVLVPNSSDPKGAAVAVPVEVGLSDGTYTQITKGLNLGDKVVVQMSSSTGRSTNNRTGGFMFGFGR